MTMAAIDPQTQLAPVRSRPSARGWRTSSRARRSGGRAVPGRRTGSRRAARRARSAATWTSRRICRRRRPSAPCARRGGKVFKIGEKFGTIGGGLRRAQVEVTTYRAEAYEPGSRKPEGRRSASSWTDDLARRDFTINAIALGPARRRAPRPVRRPAPISSAGVDPRGRRAGRAVRRRPAAAAARGALRERSSASRSSRRHGGRSRARAAALASISRERVRDELDKLLLGPAPARGHPSC